MYANMDINKQLQFLNEQIKNYERLIDQLPVYEYHIGKLKVDTVKGSLQLGKLFHGDEIETEGVHKIFVNDVIIKEVEGSGTVGVGIVEKQPKKKEPQQKISPEEAGSDIKEIYEDVKATLDIEVVPLFFQQLAVRKDILKKVWELMGNYLVEEDPSNEEFERFVSEQFQWIKQNFEDYDLITNEHIGKKIEQRLHAQYKVVPFLISLTNKLIPGYLKQYQTKKVDIEELSNRESEGPKELLDIIKDKYHLAILPEELNQLEENPHLVDYLYNKWLVPLNEQELDKHFVQRIKEFLVDYEFGLNEQIIEEIPDLSIDNLSFVLSVLIKQFTDLPKLIFLEKVTSHLVK